MDLTSLYFIVNASTSVVLAGAPVNISTKIRLGLPNSCNPEQNEIAGNADFYRGFNNSLQKNSIKIKTAAD
ncbi:hypothetical protein E3A20_04870 [Planctomyces bekefii]|uniref:Uncharacterized protein n=1 Tax=Planctomyces bekefii TaxID=1653850 RepID=A0A5C6MEZ9_9PLAN|nr:hypothetical protein E3A20_04870 [Planctomyces bekefii]